MKLALSILCENPRCRTGLTSFFHEFVRHALIEHPEISWLIFAGPDQVWRLGDSRIEIVRTFPANDRLLARLWADHFWVGPAARRCGADALVTVGFIPVRTGGLPIVMQVFSVHHESEPGLRAWYRRTMVKRGLRSAALVIANSHWTAEQLGSFRAPVLVSHEGLQHECFRPEIPVDEKRLPGLPENYLLWSSNFYPYKRVDLAIAAYAQVPEQLRKEFPLVLIGGDWHGGRRRAELAAREHGVEGDVRFEGWVDDSFLPSLYRGARALILSSQEETFGRCVAEAMASGCPCIVQDLPVLREVTEEAAELVDFKSATAAGAVIAEICRDDARVARLRAAGLTRAADFSFGKLARERLAAIVRALPA